MTKMQYKKAFPKVKPAGRHRAEANPRFRDPCHFQVQNAGWLVCQGWISTEYGPELHAWLEQGGFVLDLWFDIRISAIKYYKVLKCRKVRKYNKTECRAAMDKYRTYRFLPEKE